MIEVCNDGFFAAHGRPDVIITDPPRAGMHPKLVEKILDMEAPTVVYVSCNPATQARDLALLDAKYAVTLPASTTISDLKQTLSTAEYANLPAERQRLIYSSRVLKDKV